MMCRGPFRPPQLCDSLPPQGIVAEVRQSTQLMLTELIQQLRTNIPLPACLRVIGYLRRMDVFTEAELRIKFLQARDAWLRSIQASIPEDDPYFHLTKTVEACRVHLFDIVTQYRAIFSDEEPLLAPEQPALNEGAIFHGWVLQKVSEFLQVLERDLQRGVGGRLDSLLGQCMYFGLSFSRVGADFRGQLAPIFQRVAAATFSKAVEEAVEKFQEEMNSYTLISAPAVLGSAAAVPVPTAQPGTLQPPMVLLDFPPLACFLNSLLVAFNDLRLCCPIALAQDVASCLQDALGKVRCEVLGLGAVPSSCFVSAEQQKARAVSVSPEYCPCPSGRVAVEEKRLFSCGGFSGLVEINRINGSVFLLQVTKVILAFHRAEEAAFSGREQELFVQFCTAFLEDLLPYLNRCLQLLFPPAQIAQALGKALLGEVARRGQGATATGPCPAPSLCPAGVPPAQLQRFGRLGCIDVAAIRELLGPVLPAREAEPLPGEEEPVLLSAVPAAAPCPPQEEEKEKKKEEEEEGAVPGEPPAAQGQEDPTDPIVGALPLDASPAVS